MSHNKKKCPCCVDEAKHRKGSDWQRIEALEETVIILENKIKSIENHLERKTINAVSSKFIK